MQDIFYCDSTIERFVKLKNGSKQRHYDNFVELFDIIQMAGLNLAIFDFNIFQKNCSSDDFLVNFFCFKQEVVGVYSKCDGDPGIIILIDRVSSLCELVSVVNHEIMHFFQERTGNFVFPETANAWEIVKQDEEWHPDTAGASTWCWWEFEAFSRMRSIKESIKIYKKLMPLLPDTIDRYLEDFDPYNP